MSGENDDLAPQYAQATQEASDADILREMEEAASDDSAAPGAQQEAKVTPKLRGSERTLTDVIRNDGKTTMPGPTGSGDFVSGVGSVLGDVAVGVAETPGAFVRGAQGAAHELLDSIDSAGAWVAMQGASAIGDEATAKRIGDQRASGEGVLAPLVPEPGSSRSVTGGIVQGITQFVGGFVAGGKLLKTAGFLGRAGQTADVFLKSAFSDAFAFDPAQERLSNLIQENPNLKNPITEFLSSKPGDSEAVGRFKNSLEGLGVGIALQGVFTTAMKGLRALKTIQPTPPTAEEVTRHVKEGLSPLGDASANAPLFSVKNVKAEADKAAQRVAANQLKPSKAAEDLGQAADAPKPVEPMAKATEPNAKGDGVFINFARIETADDVKSVMQKAANLYKDDIAQAQRGVQSFEATKSLADDMGMTVDELISRPRGPNGARTPFTAEEALAARRIYTASGEKLMELAQKASGPNAGQIDLFNFRKMMATHYAIQQEVIGARTETARALSSWRIGAESGQMQMRMIEAAMETAGPDSARMAKELSMLAANGAPPAKVAQYVRQSAFGNFTNGLREVYVNGLLSNWQTHIVNSFGNIGTLALSVAERGMARQISRGIGSDAIASGEASAMLYGVLEGQKDAFRLAWKTMRTGETTDMLGKIDQPRAASIASSRNDAFGVAVNAIGATVRVPSLLMTTADQYFKAINYRANLHALAVRQANSEGLTGKAFGSRVAEIIENPPESLKIDSADAALTNTFNNSMGWFGKMLMAAREGGGPLNPTWLIAPFIRTPVNIARFSFERTPLAPLVGQWRADIAAGGARRDAALARTAVGTMIMGIAQQMVEGGDATGSLPSDANEAALWKREGRQEYSVKIGDTWFSYNRADPFGMVMGFAADMQATLRMGDVAPDDVDEWQEVMAGGVAAVANTAMDKTFMRGFAQFNDMLADPKRYGAKEINQVVTGFVPFSALGGALNRAMDPTVRDIKTPIDALMSRVPGLASRIIPRRDLWGAKMTGDSGMGSAYDNLSPLRASVEKVSPIDAELDRLHVYPEGIGWKSSINGVRINFSENPQALDEFRRLAGNDFKHPAWGLGLKDFLDQVVSGSHPMSQVYKMYSDGEQGGKAAFIRKAIQDYREMAGRELLNNPKFVSFKAQYEEEKAAQGLARQKVNLQ